MNILAIIFLFILIMMFIKIPISIFVNQNNYDGKVFLKIGLITIKRNFAIVKRKKQHIIPKKRNQKMFRGFSIKELIKHFYVEMLDININVGLLFLTPTLFSVPILSTLLELIKYQEFKHLKEYTYKVMPNYEEKITFDLKIKAKLYIQPIGILKILLDKALNCV